MKRMIVLALVIGLLVTLLAATAVDAHQGPPGAPLTGVWEGTDYFDGSHMVLIIRGGMRFYQLTVLDDSGTICDGDPYVGRGVATYEEPWFSSDTVHLWCVGDEITYWGSISWLFEYEASTDTLYEFPYGYRATVFHRVTWR